jgi:pSer/pThr/pTyr-binding forkhead associated (FHA) protein
MKLYFLNGIKAGKNVELTGEVLTLGRETDNDINLLTEGVSRYHAKLNHSDDGGWSIEDLNSTNGVKVNHERISEPHRLEEGDIIDLGDQTFRFGEPKDMSEDISKAITPSPTPIIQPSPAQEKVAEEPIVQKVVFQPIPAEESKPEPEKAEEPIKLAQKTKPEPEIIAPEPAKEPEPEKEIEKESDAGERTANLKQISDAISKGKMNLFGAKNQDNKTDKSEASGKPKKRISNLLFYTCVLCSAIIFISVFYAMQKEKEIKPVTGTAVQKKPSSFLLYYVKEKSSKDNIFRFSLLLENSKAKFIIDDLRSQRHYSKDIDAINESYLDSLKKEITNTSFMTLDSPAEGTAANNLNEIRKIVIFYKGKLNEVIVKNNFAPSSFENIERAINDFSANYGLQTIAMTPEELKKQAEKSFYKAEDLFQNREAKPENLLNAIKRYRITVEYLDQFSPKPKIWDIARKREQEAEAMRVKRVKDLKFEFSRLMRLKEYSSARELLSEIMQLEPEESKLYQMARKQRINIDRHLKKRNKK